MGCPWEYKCGYWSVFVNLYVIWDIRDSLFSLFVEPSDDDRPPNPRGALPFINVDWILDMMSPGWRDDWPVVDTNNGFALIKLYATAIKPHAREILVPATRGGQGLEDFTWWPLVSARVASAQPLPP